MNKYESFLEDIEKNIKNKEDLEYVKTKFTQLYWNCMEKDTKIEQLEERIQVLEESMKKVKKEVYMEEDSEEEEILDDVDYQFEVACPFCNTEFLADINETTKSIKCPNCEKEIELDWSDGIEDFGGCAGSCCGCSGCSVEDDDM